MQRTDLHTERMLGWQHNDVASRAALAEGRPLHLLAETSNRCDLDCEYCYTVEVLVSGEEVSSHTQVLPGELSLVERLALIDAAAELGAKTYDIVGAGEPLIDPLCLRQLEHAASRGLQPVVFTNGSVLGSRVHGRRVAERLNELRATVVVKHHGDAILHDSIVHKPGAAEKRDRAISLLMELGFNAERPTRLGIDNIIYQKTLSSMPDCLRWCRRNNLHLVCSSFIPAGRTQKTDERAATTEELERVMEECQRIDAEEFGLVHSAKLPFLGYGRACTQYLGLYVTIKGLVHGCVGKMEAYGNVRERSLADMWADRLPVLRRSFNGGCPPRRLFLERLGLDPATLDRLL